jgi:hypothetical protein
MLFHMNVKNYGNSKRKAFGGTSSLSSRQKIKCLFSHEKICDEVFQNSYVQRMKCREIYGKSDDVSHFKFF